jgi:DUF971 family protein
MGLLDRVTLQKHVSEPPEAVDVAADHALLVTWPGRAPVAIPAKALRDGCPCAGCIEEFTGKKLLDASTIPDDIRPVAINAVGNYAIQIEWSDGHGTGMYTWATLRAIGDRAAGAAPPGP